MKFVDGTYSVLRYRERAGGVCAILSARHARENDVPGRISMERRLAAIMAADVVDYSRLMGDDEEGTLAALLSFRADLFNPTVSG